MIAKNSSHADRWSGRFRQSEAFHLLEATRRTSLKQPCQFLPVWDEAACQKTHATNCRLMTLLFLSALLEIISYRPWALHLIFLRLIDTIFHLVGGALSHPLLWTVSSGILTFSVSMILLSWDKR